jgi:RNA polymerase sigma factor (TIGR02999 family)
MGARRQHLVTDLLQDLKAGNREAFADLIPLIYDDLHLLAEHRRRRWEGDETLNTTALVHETYLRMVDQASPDWKDRAHFLAVASIAMRQILLDYAKRRHAEKRGGAQRPVPLHEIEEALRCDDDPAEAHIDALVALDGALRRLAQHDPRQSRIVECRFFGGMTIADTAHALDVSPATVKRGWAMAQAWLFRDLQGRTQGAG